MPSLPFTESDWETVAPDDDILSPKTRQNPSQPKNHCERQQTVNLIFSDSYVSLFTTKAGRKSRGHTLPLVQDSSELRISEELSERRSLYSTSSVYSSVIDLTPTADSLHDIPLLDRPVPMISTFSKPAAAAVALEMKLGDSLACPSGKSNYDGWMLSSRRQITPPQSSANGKRVEHDCMSRFSEPFYNRQAVQSS